MTVIVKELILGIVGLIPSIIRSIRKRKAVKAKPKAEEKAEQ